MDGPIEWLPPEDDPGASVRAPSGAAAPAPVELVSYGRPDTTLALAWERFGDRLGVVPTRFRIAMGALAAAAISVAYLGDGGDTARPRGHEQAAERPAASATPVLVAKALQPSALGDVLRPTAQPGRCALVPPGHSPGAAAATALARILPTYRARDVGRIIDQSTGLCALDIRATDAAGSVVLVEVLPPGTTRRRSYPQISVSVDSDGSTSSSIASTVSVDGWSITVVAVGQLADQPDVADMLSLTDDTSLRW